ncbi:efflux RND transporter periplasmic adaptor subunit [Agromyces albus]|uniref:efflux RND transporter periplasmic adaptor subunit n=1 Tax=Agromyces albus TaxID=205332 RepID=UPI0013E983A6|nr:hypothetical protein [Agromyces albus]
MTVWRRWVFPILKTLLVAVVAVALVKLAFFPDRAEAENSARPTGNIIEPQVQVARGSIANDVVLTGTVNADAAVPVKATGAGAVDEVFVQQGATVRAGDVVFDIKVENPMAPPVESVGPDGMPVVTMPTPTFRFEKVVAPADGVLSSLSVIPGQLVAIGEVSGQVAPPSFNISATLAPEQQYRLTTQPSEALVTIAGGPAPFLCTGLSITTALSGQGSGLTGDGGEAGPGGAAASGTTVQCRVPGDVRVFPGLSAQVTISAGAADDVLVVPTTAVEGGADSGVVWLVTADGSHAEAPVKLGLSDGTNVEVVEGLAEGDSVLEFVPGQVAPQPGMEECKAMPDGAMVCSAL